nr:uncharacterized protein LOC127317043 [Lolium perenne]
MFVIRMPPRRAPPPPPPPPLEIGQALLNVTQILAQLAQNQAQNNEGNGRVTIREFLNLNPRTFDTPLKPLDADDWLREMNRTLNTARVAPADRVSFVTFLLRGESAAWWDSYLERRDPDVETSWDDFQALFRHHHIRDGAVDKMREEFRRLTQADMDVETYSRAFTNLARYAGDEISTDERKQDKFRRGLNPTVKFAINLIKCRNFDELVDTAIKAETGRQEFEQSRKHSRDSGSSSIPAMPPQKRRVWFPDTAPPAPRSFHSRPPGFAPRPPTPQFAHRPAQFQHRPAFTPQQHGGFVQQQRPAFGPPQRQFAPRSSSVTCYSCGQPGHTSRTCSQRQQLPPPPPRPSSTQLMVRAPSTGKAFNYNNKPRPATVNNITAEEAEKASDVVLDAGTEEYGEEYDYYPEEDRAGFSSSDLTGTTGFEYPPGHYFVDYAEDDYVE